MDINKMNEGDIRFLEDFQDSLRKHLKTVAQNQDVTTIDELEFRLGQVTDRGFNPKFRMPLFRRITNFLKKKYAGTDTRLVEALHLDVSLDSRKNPNISESLAQTRVRLTGVESIRRFCRTNQTKIENKMKREDTIMNEYDTRIQSSLEKPIEGPLRERIWEMIQNKRFIKFYRYKKRYSWVPRDQNIRWDLTVVKEASGPSFELSNVLNQPERYEIEIEYTEPVKFRDREGEFVTDSQIDRMASEIGKDVFPNLRELIKVYQETFEILSNSEMDRVIDGYKKLVGIPEFRDPFFIGMDCTPLESKHLLPDPRTGKMPILSKMATPKADGERHFLYVYNGPDVNMQGRLYLLNTRLQVKGTGLKSEKVGSLFDSEFVPLHTGRRAVLLFDTLFYVNQDLREGGLALGLEDRLKYIGDFLPTVTGYPDREEKQEQIQERVVELEPLPRQEVPELRSKEYFKLRIPPGSEMTSPLQPNQLILDGGETGNWGYHLDGIIFTPTGPYPKALPKKSRRWYEMNKWKPVNQLSNDFLVTIRKNALGQDVIYNASALGRNMANVPAVGVELGPEVIESQQDNRSYKALILQSFQVNFGQKIFVKFTGKSPFTDGVDNVAMVPIEKDGTLRTLEDNHIIYDGAVVEFIWDKGIPPNGHWVPLRFREDKTDIKLPNHIDTARSNWSLIVSPITQDMIVGDKPVPRDYYAKVDYDLKALTKNMRRFHNQVKRDMIDSVITKARELEARVENEQMKLLDIGSGQGGDLRKWMGDNPERPLIDFVLGVENNLNNITKAPDGADERYKKLKRSTKTPMDVHFLWADAMRYLNSGAAGHVGAGRETEPYKLQQFFLERGTNWFDCVSCQFALHYFTENDASLGMVLYNVFQNLRDGGYFFGTTMIGQDVFDLLKELEPGQSASGYVGSVKIWEIVKRYDQEELEDVGQQILVYNSSINGEPIPEYLVNFEHLIKFARKFGLVPVEEGEIPGFNGIGKFEELYPRYANKYPMKPDEKKYSFLNGYFIFKRNEAVADTGFITSFVNSVDNSRVEITNPEIEAAEEAEEEKRTTLDEEEVSKIVAGEELEEKEAEAEAEAEAEPLKQTKQPQRIIIRKK